MAKPNPEKPNVGVYQYLRELEHFIKDKSRSNHFMALEFIKDQSKLAEVQAKNDQTERDVKRLVVRYIQFLEGVRGDDVQFTGDELNALTAVHNMRKRDLKETIETLISFSAGQEALDAVEALIAKDLKSLRAFMVFVEQVKSL